MPQPIMPREDLVAHLFKLFRDKGFDGTSMSKISEATGLGRSSLYHFFPGGKEEMGQAVLDHAQSLLSQTLHAIAHSDALPRARLLKLIAALDDMYAGGKHACVLANFVVGDAHTLFKHKLKTLFTVWAEAFEKVAIDAGVNQAAAREKAIEAVAFIQGALIVSSGLNEMRHFQRCLVNLRENYLPKK